jgi:hypothetical protein
VQRRFHGDHTERWWVAELTLFGYGPHRLVRAICATTDQRSLPTLSTWPLLGRFFEYASTGRTRHSARPLNTGHGINLYLRL